MNWLASFMKITIHPPKDKRILSAADYYNLLEQIERYSNALKFYADHQNYGLHGGSTQAIYCDAGRRARYALANAQAQR